MRTLIETWKREPTLGLLAGLSALALALYPVWLSVRVYVPVLSGAQESVADFSFYYDAAERFVAGGALYPDAYGFMYPPPSIALFAPLVTLPMPVGFMLSVVGIAVLAVACIRLTLRLWEEASGETLAQPVQVSLLLIGLATAPVFQNLKYAQVNVLVLLTGLGFLVLLRSGRPFAAALVLSGGFWLKLYPIALALLGLRRDQPRAEWVRLAAGFAVGLVAVPVALLPVVPPELYRQYAFDLVPFWSGITNMDALNQSIVGVLEHVRQPVTDYLRSHDTALAPSTKLVNVLATGGMLGGFYVAYFFGRLPRPVAGVAMLAVTPVISGLGWEHTYVLALPLYLFVLLAARHRGRLAQAFAAASVFIFMVPKLPSPLIEWSLAAWPRPVVDVFYARFLIVTLALLAVVAVWQWTRVPETMSAPAARATGARRGSRTGASC
ncbi:MAG: glycosyltransferase family 87 protein [Bacteroidota bacterium]